METFNLHGRGGLDLNSVRIVGGKPINPTLKYPWITFLRDEEGGEDFCGGTLVASKYVISAAHCMFDKEGKPRTPHNRRTGTGFKV